MGPRMNQRDALLSEIDSLKATIKAKQAHIDSLLDSNATDARKIRDGWENRDQECYRLANWEKRVWQFFSVATKKFVADETMRPEHNKLTGHHDSMFGDIIPIEPWEEKYYTRTPYWEGKTYSFGPRISDTITDDLPRESMESPQDVPVTVLALTTGSEVSPETHHFDPNANDPVLFRNNVRILEIWDHHENEAKTQWEQYRDDWQLTDEEVDAIGEWIRDTPYPNINQETMKLRRNGLNTVDADAMLGKAGKIRDKYIAAHSLTAAEIRDIVAFCDLPF